MVHYISDKGAAIALMIISLCLLGTWPALLCLLERRGRLPQHSFLDYSYTNVLVAIIFALTLGNLGPSTPEVPNFVTQLSQNNGASVGFAVAGGVFLCLGNLSTQYSLAFIGVSLTEVVASSITVVLGTTLNFFLDGRINRAEILFPGVACFLIAAITGFLTHGSVKKDTLAKMGGQFLAGGKADEELSVDPKAEVAQGGMPETGGLAGGGRAQVGSAAYLQNVENNRAMKTGNASLFLGLSIVTFSGLMFGFFSPAFNLSTNDQWHKLPQGVPLLVVYTSYFYFSLAFFGVSNILNITFLYYPILGAPRSSIGAWLKDWNGRWIALLAGLLCGLGNAFQFMAGQAAGYAAADAVQALPLVSTFWGIVLFGEYRRCSTRTYILLVTMLVLFSAAVGLLCGSSGTRKTTS